MKVFYFLYIIILSVYGHDHKRSFNKDYLDSIRKDYISRSESIFTLQPGTEYSI